MRFEIPGEGIRGRMAEISITLKKSIKKYKLDLLLRLTVSLTMLIYIALKLDYSSLEMLDESILIYFIASLMISFLSLLIMSMRWKIIIDNILIIKTNILDLCRFYFIGNFFSIFLPGSIGGDASRIYNSGKKYDIKLKNAALYVLIERIMGLIGVILIFSFGSMIASGTHLPSEIDKIPYIFLLSLAIFAIFKDRILKNKNSLFNNKKIFILICFSVIAQFGDILIVNVLSDYFNIPITILDLMIIMPLVYIASILPISIGGLGVREGTMATLFSLFGFEPSVSVVISLLLYLTKVCLAIVGGFIYIRKI